jgi:hypothetical protein
MWNPFKSDSVKQIDDVVTKEVQGHCSDVEMGFEGTRDAIFRKEQELCEREHQLVEKGKKLSERERDISSQERRVTEEKGNRVIQMEALRDGYERQLERIRLERSAASERRS